MSLHYLVKLSIRVFQVNSSWNFEPKNTRMFLSYLLQNEPILIKLGTVHIFPIKFAVL